MIEIGRMLLEKVVLAMWYKYVVAYLLLTLLLTVKFGSGHLITAKKVYVLRFKVSFLNLPVVYIPWWQVKPNFRSEFYIWGYLS